METVLENIHYKFVPNSIVSFDNIQLQKEIFINDIYEKYKASVEVQGELLVCNDASKIKKRTKKIIDESYQDYMTSLGERDHSTDQWIYNIIDGIAEQDKVLYRDDKCVVVPTYVWDGNNVNQLHILCLPVDKSLRTIRSLDSSHIPLLAHMKRVSLYIIKHQYNLDETQLKMYFHYEPSTYHLHIHFVNLDVDGGSSVEYSHDLDSVINNLYVFSDYYKVFKLKKRYH
jgi:diadenosine tetraphosphate (Ap4A) HIT family hydrolase